ncbi:MAG: MucB/RseB C-terminal domain-containing protein [Proteobacteria bacterium]|nr:MucB/RseB C-terminal domain-containing protein [Pseudomonadota bacterium]MDA0982487.1 MucB/RseB C-terminal domain-containing protein [Pseudomonadota bacterium]
MKRAIGALLASVALTGAAQAQAPADGMSLLGRIYQATEKLSYSGIFVYQQGDRVETSRISRIYGPAGELEKIEVLDGPRREILRTRDSIKCYLPESQTIKVERRVDQRAFPAMLPDKFAELVQHYSVSLAEPARIAGYDCESVVLTPRDELRYGYKLWADSATGMLLRARTFNARGETIDQFSFTQLAIGNVPRERLKPLRSARNWRVEHTPVSPANLAGSGWNLGAELPGFRKIFELSRRLGESRPVNQVVYSDGLAAVSVFIEPLAGRSEAVRPGVSNLGAVNMYTREVANHLVTVVGEAPAASLQRIGNTVEYRRPQ